MTPQAKALRGAPKRIYLEPVHGSLASDDWMWTEHPESDVAVEYVRAHEVERLRAVNESLQKRVNSARDVLRHARDEVNALHALLEAAGADS